jgi:DNA-binding response OmpR family regulator
VWILVVEDETSMREALRQGLEEENHTVALASDGLEGVHAAETCDFDAILLDVMMPGMDGSIWSGGCGRPGGKLRF